MKARAIALLGLLVIITAVGGSTNDVLTMRISYATTPFNLPLIVLRRKGYLEKELLPLGWKVKWVTDLETEPLMAKALAAKTLDMATLDVASIVFARAAGNDLVILAPHAEFDTSRQT